MAFKIPQNQNAEDSHDKMDSVPHRDETQTPKGIQTQNQTPKSIQTQNQTPISIQTQNQAPKENLMKNIGESPPQVSYKQERGHATPRSARDFGKGNKDKEAADTRYVSMHVYTSIIHSDQIGAKVTR